MFVLVAIRVWTMMNFFGLVKGVIQGEQILICSLTIRFQPVGLKNENKRDERKGLRKSWKGEKGKCNFGKKLQKDILRIWPFEIFSLSPKYLKGVKCLAEAGSAKRLSGLWLSELVPELPRYCLSLVSGLTLSSPWIESRPRLSSQNPQPKLSN